MIKTQICLILLCVCLLGASNKNQKDGKNDITDIDVQVSFIDSTLINIHWCTNVLALTSKGSIYRSEDKGKIWFKSSEIFQRKGLAQLQNTEKQRVGIVNSIVASPINKQTVIFSGTESITWISLDCGKSISALYSAGRNLREFQFHPTNKDLILASSWNKCVTGANDNCFSYKELMLSENSGMSWHPVAQYINQFAWGALNETNFIPQNRILVSYEPKGKGHQALSGWNSEANLYYSDDFFQTRVLSVQAGARFILTQSYLFIAKVTNVQTKEISLLVADPNTNSGYSLNIVDADENLQEHSYTVLDTTEGQVFLVVSHIKAQSPIGVIYISDSTGTRYHKSLLNAVRQENSAEFHKVQGLEGIYIANVYSSEQADLYTQSVLSAMETGFGGYQQTFKDEDLQKYKQSRISFDKGGEWIPLRAPPVDSEGKTLKCDPKSCALHLHLNQAYVQYGPVYTQESSIGLIIATGSIGKYLSYRSDQVNTYLSRDGGLTWQEIHKGSHIYEISDHGGLILMANDQQGTKTLIYSWNEGLDWNVFKISDTEIQVQNIITEPSNQSTRFIVYGSTKMEVNGLSVEQGVIVTIDLDDLHQRQCIGIDTPAEGDSDYELWKPNGIINPECLLGKKVTYVRRKREAQCYNPEKIERIVDIQSCQCTNEDFECDIGFKRDDLTKNCLAINQTMSFKPPQECFGSFQVSSGYIKIAGDLCEGGQQHPQIKLSCPIQSRNIFIYVMMIVVAFMLYSLYANKDKLKQQLHKYQSEERNNQNYDQQSYQIQTFNAVNLEDNEGGLGYREFDEELLIKDRDDKLEEREVQVTTEIHKEQLI